MYTNIVMWSVLFYLKPDLLLVFLMDTYVLLCKVLLLQYCYNN